MTSKGKMLRESKKDMKKRWLKSLDRADAFVLTFGEYLWNQIHISCFLQ